MEFWNREINSRLSPSIPHVYQMLKFLHEGCGSFFWDRKSLKRRLLVLLYHLVFRKKFKVKFSPFSLALYFWYTLPVFLCPSSLKFSFWRTFQGESPISPFSIVLYFWYTLPVFLCPSFLKFSFLYTLDMFYKLFCPLVINPFTGF